MEDTMRKVRVITPQMQLSGVPERIREIIEGIKYATDVRIVVEWTEGGLPNIEYCVDENVRPEGGWQE